MISTAYTSIVAEAVAELFVPSSSKHDGSRQRRRTTAPALKNF